MEPTLTPPLALDYLQELSTDVRAGVVLDGRGTRLAGPPELAAGALGLADRCAGAAAVEVRMTSGVVALAASSSYVLVVVAGPFALSGLLLHDVTVVMALLSGTEEGSGPLLGTTGAASPPRGTDVVVRWAVPGGPLGTVTPADPRHAAVAGPGSALLAMAEAA